MSFCKSKSHSQSKMSDYTQKRVPLSTCLKRPHTAREMGLGQNEMVSGHSFLLSSLKAQYMSF